MVPLGITENMFTCGTVESHGIGVLRVSVATNADVFSEIFVACIGTVFFHVLSQDVVHYRNAFGFVID